MNLIEYNQKLFDHFNKLKENRSMEYPVFAFEHGLTENKIKELIDTLNWHGNYVSRLHRLVWIVCCTEVGYIFEGKEYWDTFNQKFPNLQNPNIYKEEIRDFFTWFEKSFNGIVPQGEWANYFVNISHPITHSIIPKQFQKLFVRDLSKYGKYADVNTIYQYMYHNCNTTRFKNFLENDHLAKLLLSSILNFENTNEIIQDNTLDRIVSDLEDEDADFKKNINQIRKIYVGNKEKKKATEFKSNLYFKFDSQDNFKLFFHLPSFDTLPQFIDLTRYRIRFTSSPVLLRGDQLLNEGGNEVILNKLAYGEDDFCFFHQIPAEEKELINLNEKFKDFIKSEIKFLNEKCLLFKINEDGVGEYLEDKTLEINGSYVVISRNELSYVSSNKKIEYIFKNNLHLYKFTNDDKENLSTSFLAECNITSVSEISFRPIGTLDRGKNKNFHEFFVDESPVFMIEASSDVTKCEIKFGDDQKNIIMQNRHEFFQLESLEQGAFYLYITPFSKSPAGWDQELKQRQKLILVRPPKLNVGFESKSIFFNINQNESTLQNFWENKLDFQIIGPKGYHPKITLILFDDNDEEITKKEILAGISLPITQSIWKDKFDQIKSQLSNEYLRSNKLKIEMEANELGNIYQNFENIQYPLKLITTKKNNKTFISVKNDTGLNLNNQNVDLNFYLFSYKKPLSSKNLLNSQLDIEKHTIQVEQTGGCYIIQIFDKTDKRKMFTDKICIAQKIPEIRDRGLKSLQNLQEIDIDLSDFDNKKYLGVFQILDVWNNSKIMGDILTFMKTQYVFDKILDEIYKEFYSIAWYNSLLTDKKYDLKLNALIRNLSLKLNSAKIINNEIQIPFKNELEQIINQSFNPTEISLKFYHLCLKLNISHNPKLISFALHLAFEPFNIFQRYGKEISSLVPKLLHNNDLSRSGKILFYIYSMKTHNKFIKIPEGSFFDKSY